MYVGRKDPSPRPYGKNILNEIENKLRKKAESCGHGFIDRESAIGISRDSLKLINELKRENDLLKQVVYAAAMFLDYFPKQIHPEINANDFLKEPPLGSTGLFEPRIDSGNVYTLARTAKETLDYINKKEG